MKLEAKNDTSITVCKALVNLIPIGGGSIASIIGDYQNQRKEKRLFEFLDSLVAQLEQEKISISQDYIKNEDFSDIFENTLRKIIYERTEEKRRFYANILANSIIQGVDYEETEYFQHLVEILTPLHISALYAFSKTKVIDGESYFDFMKHSNQQIETALSLNIDALRETVSELEMRYLIFRFLTTYEAHQGHEAYKAGTFMTQKGLRFLEFIL